MKETIALNRNLPPDWCTRQFTQRPSYNFAGINEALGTLLAHLKTEELYPHSQKFQIIVDSDLDGICSAAIFKKFADEFWDDIETIYSIHTGKQHGLSKDIKIDKDTTLVILPDAGVNDVEQCKALRERGVNVICLDHHIIEQDNPYASIVSCMDGVYPNQNLCGTAVTWLFLSCLCTKERMDYMVDNERDLVAIATISDIMPVTNEDNMYFIQNGLSNIHSEALKAFLNSQEIPLNDVTIEHIKYKVAPLISAMIRMGSMEEKTLLFRAFIDDYEEFDYEKRGSLGVETEDIYDRVVRLCKNAKSRQDRAKQKLLDSCQVHEYEHIILVEYPDEKASTLTGLVANELANQYCKPCIVYHQSDSYISQDGGWLEYSGSIRNYDGSPIVSLKSIIEAALNDKCTISGHNNAAGIIFRDTTPDYFAECFSSAYNITKGLVDFFTDNGYKPDVEIPDIAIGEKIYDVDFEVDADDVDAGFVSRMTFFDHYSGYGFAPVTVLIRNIPVDAENFKTMGKNSLSWKVSGDGVEYVKFKIPEDDVLLRAMDDLDLGCTTYPEDGKLIDAICTFGINIYKGVAYPQAIVKDYEIVGSYASEYNEYDDDELDLDLGI